MRLLIALLVFTSVSMADVMVLIQPSADLHDIVWTVSWDSLAGNDAPDASWHWESMNPADGADVLDSSGDFFPAWGDFRLQQAWNDVGDPFGPAYSGGFYKGFGDGFGGVVGSGDWGVGPDDDHLNATGTAPDVNGDDLWIFSTVLTTGDVFPTSGSFVLTVPGAHLANYNVGVYNHNPYVTIIVTDTPHVPEPGTLVLFGVAALGAYVIRRRRKAS